MFLSSQEEEQANQKPRQQGHEALSEIMDYLRLHSRGLDQPQEEMKALFSIHFNGFDNQQWCFSSHPQLQEQFRMLLGPSHLLLELSQELCWCQEMFFDTTCLSP